METNVVLIVKTFDKTTDIPLEFSLEGYLPPQASENEIKIPLTNANTQILNGLRTGILSANIYDDIEVSEATITNITHVYGYRGVENKYSYSVEVKYQTTYGTHFIPRGILNVTKIIRK